MKHDTVRRGLRTFAHTLVAALALTLPTDLLVAAALYVEIAAAAVYAAASGLLSWLHAELEDAEVLPDTRHANPEDLDSD